MTTKQELGPNQKKWLEALRSGKYQQGKNKLRDSDDRFCCLGVACEVLNVSFVAVDGFFYYDGNAQISPVTVVNDIALYGASGDNADRRDDTKRLTYLNDHGKTFAEIADIIEADPAGYFKESK